MKKVLLAAALCLCGSLTATAQDSLSLGDAVARVLDANFDIAIQKYDQQVAENNNTWGAAGRWPTVTASLAATVRRNEVVVPTNPFQISSTNRPIVPGVDLAWVLFDGFRVNTTKARLATLEEQSGQAGKVVVETALQAVILAYYNVLREQQRLQVFQQTLRLSGDRLALERNRKEMGTSDSFLINQARGNYLNDSINLLTQEVAVADAQRQLNLLMRRNPGDSWLLTDSLTSSTSVYDLPALEGQLSTNNAELQNQYLAQQLAQHDKDLANASWYPRLTLNSSINLVTQETTNDVPPDFPFDVQERVTGRTDNYSVGFTLSYTLFDGLRAHRELQSAKLRLEQAQLTTEQLTTELKRDLYNAHDAYQLQRQLYRLSEESLAISQQNLALAQERFKLGTIGSFDYRDVQLQQLNAALRHAEASFSTLEAEVTLWRLTGALLEAVE